MMWMPKICSTQVPAMSETARMTITASPTSSPIRRCWAGVRPAVTYRTTGSVPIGLQIVDSATALVIRVGAAIVVSMRHPHGISRPAMPSSRVTPPSPGEDDRSGRVGFAAKRPRLGRSSSSQ